MPVTATRMMVVVGLLGLLTGGLGGSIFTYLISRPKPTVVTYNVVTTVTGGDKAKSVIPNLHLRIGDEDVSTIYTHTVDLVVQSGPQVESANVGIRIPAEARIFGWNAQGPTELHHMKCVQKDFGFDCETGPLTSGEYSRFQFSVATDKLPPNKVWSTTNGVTLLRVEEYLKKVEEQREGILQRLQVGLILFLGLLGAFVIRKEIKAIYIGIRDALNDFLARDSST